MALEIVEEDIGGARVRMGFTRGNVRMKAGDHLSADEVRSIPRANRRALTSAGYIEVYPRSVASAPAPARRAEPSERFIVQVAKDKFNVIAGRLLNSKPLDKAAAQRLADKSE